MMLGLSGLLLAGVAVIVTAVLLSRRWRVVSLIDKMPGEMAIPFLGNTYRAFFLQREDYVDYLGKMTKTYWPIYRVWIGLNPDVHFVKPEHIEGHDTTSVGMAWALFLLGHHPDVQEKIYSELSDIFGEDVQRRPTMQDLNNMKYLEMVIKESQRFHPSVPFIARKLTQDVEVGGYHLPKGTMAMLHIRKVHRDPDHWPDPERFNPDNFLPESVQGRHPYAYVPFSAGLRNCIGQRFAVLEEKTVLSYILRSFRVEAVERLEEVRQVIELVLRPLNGVYLRLTPR